MNFGELFSTQPILAMLLTSGIVILLSCVVMMIVMLIQHIKGPSLWLCGLLFLVLSTLVQSALILIIFQRQGEYHNDGILGLYYFLFLLLLPPFIAFLSGRFMIQKTGQRT